MSSPRVLTVDCGASHVSCAIFVTGENDALKLEQFAVKAFVLGAADEKRWEQTITEALRELLTTEKIALRDCVLAIPGHLALTKFVKTPAVDRTKRSRVVQFEASQAIPYPLSEVSWGYWAISDDGADLDLMLSAVKLEAMEGLCRAVEAAGLKVTRAETVTLALWRACRWNYTGNDSSLLMVDIGARSTQLLFTMPRRFFARTLVLGGSGVTQALAEKFQIAFAQAEELKLQALGGEKVISIDAINRPEVDQAVAAFQERLQIEIMRSRLGYSRQAGAEAPRKVLLTGRGSRVPGLMEMLAMKSGIPVEHYDALRMIELGHRMKRDGVEEAQDSLAVLTGLAVPMVKPSAPVLDLLPPERRQDLVWKRRQPWWLAAAALLLIPVLFPITYYQVDVVRQNKLAATYEKMLVPLRRIGLRNQDNLKRIDKLRTQADVMDLIVGRRTNWLAFMADLQDRLTQVGDVWLERLQIKAVSSRNTGQEEDASAIRLEISGRLLDTENPLTNASDRSRMRVNILFGSLRSSPFVKAVEDDRFDNSQSGVLRFDVTVVLNPENPL